MRYLLLITLLWAFSFSLIGVYLRNVDPWFSVLVRTFLAMVVFLPFLKPMPSVKFKLMAIGAVQLGLMYGFYYHSFLYLSVPEVLLFTVLTPLYVTLLNDLLDKRFNKPFFIAALVAVIGALTIRLDNVTSGFLFGLLLVQCANICFAFGQVSYKRLMSSESNLAISENPKALFGYFYIGAFILALACYALFGNVERLPTTTTEWGILVYLGVVASGLGYLGWNHGATRVNVGTLAAMNNLLIPAGIIVNLIIWNREADLSRLSIGGGIILLSLWLSIKIRKANK
ncbi:DMT family transporter [Psychrosphaera haliotis]|uniref:EamA family transporter n=1 Tax=Psychrosphaera haliotis TaxID=555083 RepID=A0A6N8FCI8_9GAMM|nr:DMT family transporter [Psychrosphaera haliotis]MUH72071.1 EamA family transporter [Psychrosphaera haliotis]